MRKRGACVLWCRLTLQSLEPVPSFLTSSSRTTLWRVICPLLSPPAMRSCIARLFRASGLPRTRVVCPASRAPPSSLSKLRISCSLCVPRSGPSAGSWVCCVPSRTRRSIMWLTSPLKACQQTPCLSTSLHQCMFGSFRRKATRILHTNPYLQKLGLACDGSHAHEPWRSPAQNRQKDSSFPPVLCKAYADAVVSQLVACGVAAPSVALADAPLSLSLAARVATSSQPTGRKVPPLVPEFACLVRLSGPSRCLPCTQKSKLKSPWRVPSTLRCQPYVPTLPAGAKCLQARPCVGAASALKSGFPVEGSCGSRSGFPVQGSCGSALGVALGPR